MIKTRPRKVLLAAIVCACLGAGSVFAGFDIDLGARVRIGDDNDVFLTVAANYYDNDKERVRNLSYRYNNDPDELAVALFISSRSGRSAEWVYRQRREGCTWWQISVKAGLPRDTWFVPVKRQPGPPYGKAYGHWKKHKHNRTPFVLTDEDARNLIAVRMIHEYYEVPVDVAMDWRSSGRNVRVLMTQEYHRRHGHEKSSARAEKANRSNRGKGKNKR